MGFLEAKREDDFISSVNYEVINNNEELYRAVKFLSKQPLLGVDTENTGIDPHSEHPLLLQIGTSEKCYVFPTYRTDLDWAPIKQLLENPSSLKILFNAKYDYAWLWVKFGIRIANLFCLQVAERIITVGMLGCRVNSSLAHVVKKYLGITLSKEVRNSFIGRDPVLKPIVEKEYAYAAGDIALLIDVYYQQILEAKELGLMSALALEMEVLPAVSEAEVNGCLIDQELWYERLGVAKKKLQDITKQIFKYFEPVVAQRNLFGLPLFNLNSSEQLKKNLIKLNKELDVPDTEEGTLKKYKHIHPVIDLILLHRGFSKVISTYGQKLLDRINKKTGRLHPRFNQVRAETGRMSSTDPNAQNIPAYDPDDPNSLDFRSCFVARPGYKLVCADFSQQELRVLADFSGDPTFFKAYTEKDAKGKDLDVHTMTASEVFGVPYDKVTVKQRKTAKCVHPDTLVFTEGSGYIPINTVARFSSREDTFLDVEDDVGVLNQNNSFTKVLKTYSGTDENLVVVAARRGVVVCSENHKFLTEDGELIRAADLCEHHILKDAATPALEDKGYSDIPHPFIKGIPDVTLKPNNDWAYFSGVFLGDGTANKESAYICSGNPDTLNLYGEPEYRMWIEVLGPFLKGMGFSSSCWSGCSVGVYLGSSQVVNFLKALSLVKSEEQYIAEKEVWSREDGDHSHKILRVPQWIISAGREAFLHFLGGLIDTDGWVAHRDGNAGFCSKDPVFVGQIVALSRAAGLKVSVEPAFNKTYQRWYWKLNFSKFNSTTLCQYMKNTWRKSLLKPCTTDVAPLPNKVLKVVKYHRLKQRCVDISIDSADHIYATNGLFTHNTVNFLLVYGGGAQTLSERLGIPFEEAEEIIDNYFKKFNRIKRFLDRSANDALNIGYSETISGRKRFLPLPDQDDSDFERKRNSIKRKGRNNKIQGSSADVTKKAMVYIWNALIEGGYDARILLVVHDEFVIEVREDQAEEVARLAEREMIRGYSYYFKKIPMVVDAKISHAWAK